MSKQKSLLFEWFLFLTFILYEDKGESLLSGVDKTLVLIGNCISSVKIETGVTAIFTLQ